MSEDQLRHLLRIEKNASETERVAWQKERDRRLAAEESALLWKCIAFALALMHAGVIFNYWFDQFIKGD